MRSNQISNTMSQEEVQERLRVMRLQEDSKYLCYDYLATPPRSRNNGVDTIDHFPRDCDCSIGSSAIDEECRTKMAQWCFQVIDYIKFRRETVSIAMNYLDRFLCCGCPRAEKVMNSRREYQLASMTTLFMAIKLNEPIVVDIHLMAELSKGVYKESDFLSMESDILFGLNWYVNGPTAYSFAVHLLTLLQHKQDQIQSMGTGSSPSININELLQLAAYKIELAVGEHKLMTQKPSVIATASIWSCLEDLYQCTANIASFQQTFFDIVSNCHIQLDCLQETKDCIQQAKLGNTMKMRSLRGSLFGGQSLPPSTPSTPSIPVSQNVSWTKSHSQHDCSSPICISKRNVVGVHR